jgi:hypothetical protein
MSSLIVSDEMPTPEQMENAKTVRASFALDTLITITSGLRRLVVWGHWRTAPFFAEDVTEARRQLRMCLQYLNQIESEIDKRG